VRPEVIVNCAMSADGKIASRLRRQVKLSDEEDMARVHRLRNECDAVLVGIGTVMADDPSLIVKEKYVEGEVRQPIRVILDPKCRVFENREVLDGNVRTIFVVREGYVKELANAEVYPCGQDDVDLRQLLEYLGEIGIKKLLIEGGGETIWHFVRSGLIDRFIVFISNRLIGGRDAPTPMDGEGFAGEEDFASLMLRTTTVTTSGIILEFSVD
jgi:2,5-diamino-6-(ribosylamino)-4(3H)-pyrimidinone 5'-phosphate reductase